MIESDEFKEWLRENTTYSDLSVSVKSQIKRAVKWYTMFANQKDKQNNSKSKEKGVD